MKRFFLAFTTIICVGLGLAIAQTLNRSLQLSQSPLGPINVDTANSVYFPTHVNTTARPPTFTVGTCGTSPTIVGGDLAGTITEGTGSVSACSLNWQTAYTNAPFCVASSNSPTTPVGITAVTPGGITFSHTATSVSIPINYICMGRG